MPKVNNLMDSAPVVKPEAVKPVAETVVITKADVGVVDAGMFAKEDAAIVSINQNNDKINLPSFLSPTGDSGLSMPGVADRPETGYVGFCHNMSKKYGEMRLAGLVDGQPYLFSNKQYTPLNPLSFFMVGGTTYLTQMVGQDGKFVYIYKGKEIPQHHRGKVDADKVQAHYVVLLLVFHENRLIPIKGDFRGPKSNCVEAATNAIEAAGKPDWLGRSDAHKVTAAFPQPWGRVFTTVNMRPYTGKKSGNTTTIADGISRPATASQLQLLASSFNDPKFTKDLADAFDNYQSRVKFIDEAAATLGMDKLGK